MSDQRLPEKYRQIFKVDTVNEMWRKLLTEGDPGKARMRRVFGLLPHNPRCASCHSPFAGLGGWIGRTAFGSRRSTKNPRYCNVCEAFQTEFQGGAEIELTMMFVDVRGSTAIAERMEPAAFSALMNRFYEAAINVLIHADAFIDKLVGDAVTAHFFPGYAGQQHARRAVQAGQAVLRATGYGQPGGAWVPVGVGIHTGFAWVGAIAGASGATADFTALGDNVNVAARLAANAGSGEVVVSDETYQAAQLADESLEKRSLELKGKSHPVMVRVLHAS